MSSQLRVDRDEAIYSAYEVSIRYGGVLALDKVSLSIRPGEVHGLLGANGAGKSSLVKILAGVHRPDSGSMFLEGKMIAFANRRAAVAAGVATVSQELNLFPDLSVLENLFLMREPLHVGTLANRSEMRSRAQQPLDAVGLSQTVLDQPLRSLSLGAQQLVEIARALLENPRVLMLDEPTSALKAAETRRLLDVIAQMRDRNVGIVLVSHFLEDVLECADVLTVLRGGRVVEEGVPTDRVTSQALIEAMLGPADAGRTRTRRGGGLPLAKTTKKGPLILRDVQVDGLLESLTVTAEAGEVVGLAGLDGSGAAETLRVIFGELKSDGGQMTLPNGQSGPRDINGAVRAGVAYVPADRKALGLLLDAPVSENVAMVTAGPLRRLGAFPAKRNKTDRAQAWGDAISIVMSSPDALAGTLSGGNQQKVVFAKWLETTPDVVLLDDPTRGVDVGAKADMMEIIREVASSGRIVLYTSSDLDEMAQTCDRVLVFYRGRVIGQLHAPLDEHVLLEAITTGLLSSSPGARPS